MQEKKNNKPLSFVKFGGYLVILGILLGATLGVLGVVNPWLSSRLVGISQYETIGFFLGVNLPASVIVVAIGYIFATTASLDGGSIRRSIFLSVLGVVCLVASALSVFNFLSFLGGFVVLTGVLLAHTAPSFKAASGREAWFLTEFGATLIVSSATLFSFMWLIARFVPTYLLGTWRLSSDYPALFLIMTIIALLMLSLTAGLRISHPSAGGFLSLILAIVVSVTALQTEQLYVNLSGYLGRFTLIIGIVSAFFGSLINIGHFFAITPKLDYETIGTSRSFKKYCAYCGTIGEFEGYRKFCSRCGRSPTWRPGAPFCPFCGRVIPKDVHACPHCQERLS